ncbi:MAG: DUF2442 domain-containing protein [Pontiellaceae bacterium]|nr:DUF2442 domain-containing protein [Pontiellaceae bacterium]
MNKFHHIASCKIENKVMNLVVDSHAYQIDLANESEKLAKATTAQLEDFTVSPSGYGIHWPQVDEDLAIDPLIGVKHEAPDWKVAEEHSEYKTKKDRP